MSITQVKSVWESSPYSGVKLVIHLALADHAKDDGLCWPKQESLAKKARCSVRYIIKVLKEMVEDGILVVFTKGRQHAYRLLPRVNTVQVRGEHSSGPEVNTVQVRGEHSSGPYIEPSVEPSLEPQTNPPSPSAREEDQDMQSIGALPGDTPSLFGNGRPMKPRFEPKQGTHPYLVQYFARGARRAGHPEHNVKALVAAIRDLRDQHGYDYYEIETLMAVFFARHDQEIRSFIGNVSIKFRHMMPQLMKESQGQVSNRRAGTVPNTGAVEDFSEAINAYWEEKQHA